MTLMEAVLNNIPAAVVVVDEQDRVVMDNLAYKTFCADCGGRELLTELQVSRPDDARRGADPAGGDPRGRALAVGDLLAAARRQRRGQPLLYRQRPARTTVVIADCTQQRQQQEQGRLDRLKQQMTAGKLLAAIRESLDAALIQLNCPINMLAAARRLNGEQRQRGAGGRPARRGRGDGPAPALSSVAGSRKPRRLAAAALFRRPVRPLPHPLRCRGLQLDMASPHLIGFGQRTQLLACLSLWFDRTGPRRRAAFRPAGDAALCRGKRRLAGAVPDRQRAAAAGALRPLPDALNSPGKGMELRLIQTWWRTIAGPSS